MPEAPKHSVSVTVTIDRLTGLYKNLNRAIVALVFRCHPDNEPLTAPQKPLRSAG